jgi:hypothetical protein
MNAVPVNEKQARYPQFMDQVKPTTSPDTPNAKAAAAGESALPQPVGVSHTRLPEDFYDSATMHLQLSRARVLEHLGRTKHPSHRAMLERALEDIEKRLNRQ